MTTAQASQPWHAFTWLAWALAAGAAIQLAPNPVYVAVVLTLAWIVVGAHGHDGPFARAFGVLVGVASVFAVLRIVLTALTTHGSGDVLFTLPSFTMPELLGGFTVGGAIQSGAVLSAAVEGLVIVGIIGVFAAFNAVVSHYALVQAMPRAFYEIGLVVVVAVAFVPSTIAAIHDVREADRARTGGRAVRRGRLVRQLVPVLECGLERAVTLAESLDSRGFARAGASTVEHTAAWVGVASLLALGASFVALVARETTMATMLALAGAVGIAIAVALASRGARRVRYRPRRLTRADAGVMLTCASAPLALALLSVADDTTLSWTSDPLHWPDVGALPLLALGLLLAPLARRPGLAPATATAPIPEPAVAT